VIRKFSGSENNAGIHVQNEYLHCFFCILKLHSAHQQLNAVILYSENSPFPDTTVHRKHQPVFPVVKLPDDYLK